MDRPDIDRSIPVWAAQLSERVALLEQSNAWLERRSARNEARMWAALAFIAIEFALPALLGFLQGFGGLSAMTQ